MVKSWSARAMVICFLTANANAYELNSGAPTEGAYCPEVRACNASLIYDVKYRCVVDVVCPDGYKCCRSHCYVHKVCVAPVDARGVEIIPPPTSIDSTTESSETQPGIVHGNVTNDDGTATPTTPVSDQPNFHHVSVDVEEIGQTIATDGNLQNQTVHGLISTIFGTTPITNVDETNRETDENTRTNVTLALPDLGSGSIPVTTSSSSDDFYIDGDVDEDAPITSSTNHTGDFGSGFYDTEDDEDERREGSGKTTATPIGKIIIAASKALEKNETTTTPNYTRDLGSGFYDIDSDEDEPGEGSGAEELEIAGPSTIGAIFTTEGKLLGETTTERELSTKTGFASTAPVPNYAHDLGSGFRDGEDDDDDREEGSGSDESTTATPALTTSNVGLEATGADELSTTAVLGRTTTERNLFVDFGSGFSDSEDDDDDRGEGSGSEELVVGEPSTTVTPISHVNDTYDLENNVSVTEADELSTTTVLGRTTTERNLFVDFGSGFSDSEDDDDDQEEGSGSDESTTATPALTTSNVGVEATGTDKLSTTAVLGRTTTDRNLFVDFGSGFSDSEDDDDDREEGSGSEELVVGEPSTTATPISHVNDTYDLENNVSVTEADELSTTTVLGRTTTERNLFIDFGSGFSDSEDDDDDQEEGSGSDESITATPALTTSNVGVEATGADELSTTAVLGRTTTDRNLFVDFGSGFSDSEDDDDDREEGSGSEELVVGEPSTTVTPISHDNDTYDLENNVSVEATEADELSTIAVLGRATTERNLFVDFGSGFSDSEDDDDDRWEGSGSEELVVGEPSTTVTPISHVNDTYDLESNVSVEAAEANELSTTAVLGRTTTERNLFIDFGSGFSDSEDDDDDREEGSGSEESVAAEPSTTVPPAAHVNGTYDLENNVIVEATEADELSTTATAISFTKIDFTSTTSTPTYARDLGIGFYDGEDDEDDRDEASGGDFETVVGERNLSTIEIGFTSTASSSNYTRDLDDGSYDSEDDREGGSGDLKENVGAAAAARTDEPRTSTSNDSGSGLYDVEDDDDEPEEGSDSKVLVVAIESSTTTIPGKTTNEIGPTFVISNNDFYDVDDEIKVGIHITKANKRLTTVVLSTYEKVSSAPDTETSVTINNFVNRDDGDRTKEYEITVDRSSTNLTSTSRGLGDELVKNATGETGETTNSSISTDFDIDVVDVDNFNEETKLKKIEGRNDAITIDNLNYNKETTSIGSNINDIVHNFYEGSGYNYGIYDEESEEEDDDDDDVDEELRNNFQNRINTG